MNSANDYNLDFYLHLNGTRLTVNAKNFNWITLDVDFELNHTQKVNIMQHNRYIGDANILVSPKSEDLFLVCGLEHEIDENENNDHLDSFNIKVVDLNASNTNTYQSKNKEKLKGPHV